MVDIDQLVGRYVRIVDLNGEQDFPSAVIRKLSVVADLLFLEFTSEVRFGTQAYSVAVASPHDSGDDLMTLFREGELVVALTCVPRDRFDSAKPFDVSWWRGGGAATAQLILRATDARQS